MMLYSSQKGKIISGEKKREEREREREGGGGGERERERERERESCFYYKPTSLKS